MRILHVYAGNLYGGIENLLATLAWERAASDAAGLTHEYALCFEGRLADELRAAGAMVHHLGAVRFRQPWTLPTARRRLRRVLYSTSTDILICHGSWPLAVFGSAARRGRARLGFWLHNSIDRPHWIDRLAACARPNVAIAGSRFTAEALGRSFPSTLLGIVPCPVPAPNVGDRAATRAKVRRELGTASNTVVVAIASRLEPLKGHAVLIAALERLRERPGWEAWIIGGAQRDREHVYLKSIRVAVDAAGIGDRVRFLGERSDVPRLFAAADVHCQPNTGPEGFGIAFVEALDAGLPVVTTRLGAAPEIVTTDCGILVEPGDTAGLGDALGRLIADPEHRVRLGSAGPARARALCDPMTVLARLAEALGSESGSGAAKTAGASGGQ